MGMTNFQNKPRSNSKTIQCPEATVRFLIGGTQTNQVVINTVLEPYEGVISADTGHVAVHEGGAIEFSGHKVLAVPSHEGKISPKEVNTYLETFIMISNVNIWYFLVWCIFLILLNMERFIVKKNLGIYQKSVRNIIFHYLWMAPD